LKNAANFKAVALSCWLGFRKSELLFTFNYWQCWHKNEC
jgi:hypothetical protein